MSERHTRPGSLPSVAGFSQNFMSAADRGAANALIDASPGGGLCFVRVSERGFDALAERGRQVAGGYLSAHLLRQVQ